MAQRVQVVLEDDLDGGKADETVTFGLDGTTYEIDLSKKNAAKLRDAMAGYVGAGRRVSGRRGGVGRARGRGRSASDSADIRAWAKDERLRRERAGPDLGRGARGVQRSQVEFPKDCRSRCHKAPGPSAFRLFHSVDSSAGADC